MPFSRKHYRAVSPKADTPAMIAWRLADNEARELATADQATKYPTLTLENIQGALEFFEERRRWHLDSLTKDSL